MRDRSFWGAAQIALLTLLAAAPAHADITKDQCVEANGKAQELRRGGKLAEAREQLRTCGNPRCPALVRDDCTKRLNELEGVQPTIIFGAKDGSGRDMGEVVVTMDGRPFAENLDGTALRVDPGQHEFTFTAKDQPPVTQTFIIREGEKDRREPMVIGAPAPPGPTPAPAPAPPEPSAEPPSDGATAPTTQGLGTRKVLGLAVGGVGLAGIAVGSVFGALTASEASKQKSDCSASTNCPNRAQAASEHSAASTDGTVSTVAFIAGGALLVTGAVLFFTAKRDSQQPPATGLVVAPTAGPNGAGMILRGEF